MKVLSHLWLVLIVSFVLGCSSKPDISVKFCDTLDQNERCQTDRDHFVLGERVFVSLEADSPFETERISGEIYRIDRDTKIPLSSKEFELEPGDIYISQNIPFHEFGYEALGTFSIEFTDEKEQLIAKRELTITRE